MLLVILTIGGSGCQNDNEPGPEGFIFSTNDRIYFPGQVLSLKGTFKDQDGILQIQVLCEELSIDHLVDLSSSETLIYQLDFRFELSELIKPGKYTILVMVMNKQGIESEFQAFMDFAKLPTTKNLQTFYSGKAGDSGTLFGQLMDEQGLSRYRMICLDLDIELVVDISGNPTSYELSEQFYIRSDMESGQYPMAFEIINSRHLRKQIPGMIQVVD